MTTPDQYTVVARRYRPQLFDDLVGQDHIARALSNAIASNRVGHAYLFTGARGVGKTSSARIFAKCLNCEQGPTSEPCNECDVCSAVSAGEDVDVLEIDGASNRGIDEIRQLRSNAGIRPSRARFKIYIIDEVHMLTTQAFNALLKTLEEPPGHVKFIFCTTDPQKIPITVLSRCQRFDFSPVQSGDITDRLAEIAENENVTADRDALALLARRANGSMRDSQSLLEQLFSFCGDNITVDEVNQLLGTADMSRIADIAAVMTGRDAAASLQLIHKAISDGVDSGQLAVQLLGYYRDMMAVHVGCGEENLLNCNASDIATLQKTGEELGLETILTSVQILDGAVVKMQSSVHTRTLLEVAIVRICNLEKLESVASLVEALAGGATPTARPARKPSAGVKKNEVVPDSRSSTTDVSIGNSIAGAGSQQPVDAQPAVADQASVAQSTVAGDPAVAPSTGTQATGKQASGAHASGKQGSGTQGSGTQGNGTAETNGNVAEDQAAYQPPAAEAASEGSTDAARSGNGADSQTSGEGVASIGTAEINSSNAAAIWQKALSRIEDMTADLASQYEKLEIGTAGKLVVTLTDSYNRDMCARADRKQKLEEALQSVTGRQIRVDFRAAENSVAAARPHEPTLTRRQQLLQLHDHPFVKRTMETFDAEIVDFHKRGRK